jgi:uncharacterized metal-binding protein
MLMASGKNHDRSILFTTPIIGIIGVSYSLELGIVAASAHLLGGLYLSPDLDLVSRPYKRWGWLRWIWIPYQKFIPHRSPLSHAPVIGSLIRLGYLAIWLSCLWVIFPGLQKVEWAITWNKAIAFLVGVELSALNHLLLDGLLLPLPASVKQRLKGN